jgi:hypothetical protein
LLPWPKERNYELSFELGKNVVGILPGSDTNCSGQIVLLSAHYDHLGKDAKGNIYPGAADNASGVAALLEAARQLSRPERRPRRTLAFAAFDAEEQMMLGSFAFCCRPDLEQVRIVAVINVDTLGRDFLDVMQNTLFVAGTEGRPALQAQVRGYGTEAGLCLLPLSSDFIGPRSDHVAFETKDRLCLFFTCGTYGDYHQPGDTAEKLNYANVERSTQVILKTVEALANQEQTPAAGVADEDPAELRSLQAVLTELCARPEKARIQAQDLEALQHLSANIQQHLETGTYDARARDTILLEAASHVMPYAMGGRPGARARARLLWGEHLYLHYHSQWREGQKALVAAALQHPPGLFRGLPAFNRQFYAIRDQDISVVQAGTNAFALHALAGGFVWITRTKNAFWPFKSSTVTMEPTLDTLDCEGSREQLTDFCLLRLRVDPTNTLRANAISKVLRAVTGAKAQGGYAEWLQARLAQAGGGAENEWLLSCLQSANPDLALAATWTAGDSRDARIQAAACDLLRNRELRVDVRQGAIHLAERHPNQAFLLSLAEVLDDPSRVHQRELCPQFLPGYPLTNSTTLWAMRPLLERRFSQFTNTIGQRALQDLRQFTKKDFGGDVQAWKNWVQNSNK